MARPLRHLTRPPCEGQCEHQWVQAGCKHHHLLAAEQPGLSQECHLSGGYFSQGEKILGGLNYIACKVERGTVKGGSLSLDVFDWDFTCYRRIGSVQVRTIKYLLNLSLFVFFTSRIFSFGMSHILLVSQSFMVTVPLKL